VNEETNDRDGGAPVSEQFDERLVRHVAELARLRLSDEDVATAAAHLSQIVGYVDLLNELDTTGIAETAHPLGAMDVMRDDVVRASVAQDAALRHAPDQADGCFRVPRVLDQGGA